MVKEFRLPENTEKLASVQNFLLDRPEITKFVIKNKSFLYIKRNYNASELYYY